MADDGNDALDDQLVVDDKGVDGAVKPEIDPKVPTAKQVADLISARDKETARANAAETALQVQKSAGKPEGGSTDPATAVLMQEVREASLDAVFAANPKLADFGIDRELVEGGTRAEMRESALKLVALIEQVETKARNATLATHGLSPEPLSTTRGQPVDYSSMSKEDFEKAVAAAKRG